MIKTKKKYKQRGGVVAITAASIITKVIISLLVGILLKIIIGIYNLRHAQMYSNEIIEENNKKLNANYLS